MTNSTRQILTTSSDPQEAVRAALAIARAENAADHEALFKQLENPKFLDTLDSEEDYDDTGIKLRVSRVVEALAGNRAPSARHAIVRLTNSRAFTEEVERIDALILACAELRPPPPEVVRFWNEHCHPKTGSADLVIEALLVNGTPPAMELLEQKMAEPGFPDEHKVYWMRDYILPHRRGRHLLDTCRSMLGGTLAEDLRPPLVGVLFDYQPDSWYRPDDVPTPPAESATTEPALQALKSVGAFALRNVRLEPDLKKLVEDEVARIEKATRGP